jgi:signal transduction histidine kinase
VRRFEFFTTTTFRWAVALAAAFALAMALLSAFIYWQTVGYLTRRVDTELMNHAQAIVGASPADRADRIERYLQSDVALPKVAGLFDTAGRLVAGNLKAIPAGLPTPGSIGDLNVPSDRVRKAVQSVRVVSLRATDGTQLILGRGVRAIKEIDEIVRRALLLALIPTIGLALLGGVVLSHSALRRIATVHRASRLIMAGQLGERLPVRGRNDDFDKLARIVNEMLDEIERLMTQAKGAGEDIAHDLRTPLTRLRGRLERILSASPPGSELTGNLEVAISEIDQILTTITAILRIAEVDQGQRRAGFREVDLADIVRDAADLYEAIAEEKGLEFTVIVRDGPSRARGDGDLLFEAVANLLDNAIKFTPSPGRVEVLLQHRLAGPSVQVTDNGPGIPAGDLGTVLRRFHRGDRSRNTPGNGLGLSLVASITRLHGYGLVLHPQPVGCSIELECWTHDMSPPP